ncbi:DUF1828 domain-containing protein [Natronomonas salina]|uniref:DUF1828 domain-containing protein n=1 Tax=Natronomonas salina TaxID=1710540 RepID=UPI0015B385F7|nr:DUF1828 domain-containing protein [Natronomonas salina]QLD89200.1 DUF1828 domain-containing protein [Natronomonas salina]
MFDCTDTIRPALEDALDAFEIERDDNSCRVLTPFQQQNGDLVRLWIQPKAGDQLLIRDYGETFAMLELYGVNPKSDANKPRVRTIKKRFNLVDGFEGEIAAISPSAELGHRIVDVIQAVQAVSYLIYTHQTKQPSRFRTTVSEYLEGVGYDYKSPAEVQGATEPREFDIGINHREPMVLLDTVHSKRPYLLRQQVDRVKLNWWEIQDTDYSHGAIIDDVDGLYEDEIVDQLTDSLDYCFRWSNKEEITQEIPVKA